MNIVKTIQAVLMLIVAASIGYAQQPAGPPKPAGPPAKRVAFINSAALQDQIGEYKAKIDGLNRRFEPQVKSLQEMADRANALEGTMKSQVNVLTPARVAEMTEQLAQMKRDYQRKQEDLQADGEREKNLALDPVKRKMSAFMQDYAAKRGIAVIIDLAAAFEANMVVWFDARADVTMDFVAEYNKANPVPGAAPAPPKP